MRTILIALFVFSMTTTSQAGILVDESYLSGCVLEIGVVSCDGKVFLGDDAGYGTNFFPDNIHGLPSGKSPGAPQIGSDELLSLGSGGWVTLKFKKPINNGPGPDIRVFENPFIVNGNEFVSFTETAYVEVSQDGETFYRFPASVDETDPEYFVNPYNFQNLAGVFPVYANDNVDPFGSQIFSADGTRELGEGPGGDDFDLDNLSKDLGWIQYIRIIDTNGEIKDFGDVSPGDPTGGFDLDAVVGLN